MSDTPAAPVEGERPNLQLVEGGAPEPVEPEAPEVVETNDFHLAAAQVQRTIEHVAQTTAALWPHLAVAMQRARKGKQLRQLGTALERWKQATIVFTIAVDRTGQEVERQVEALPASPIITEVT